MEKASTIIKDILQEVLVQASEQPIQGADSNTVIRYMNRYMASLDAQGVSLGYTKINNPDDPLTVPDGALEGIVFNVAKRILSQYDVVPVPTFIQNARDSEKVLFRLGVTIEPTAYPDTLPMGSGNEWDAQYESPFYAGVSGNDIATETNRSIGLENDTEN